MCHIYIYMCIGGGGGQGQRTLQAPHTMQWAVRQRSETATSVPPRPLIPATTIPTASTGRQQYNNYYELYQQE